MAVIKLIKTEIERAISEAQPIAKGARLYLWDKDVKGFGLVVTSTGTATFIFQHKDGKGRGANTQKVTIGRYPNLTPAVARDIAKAHAGTVAHGGNPAGEIREDKAKATVAEVGERFLRDHVAVKLKEKTAYDYEKLFAVISAELGNRKLANLTTREITQFHLRMRKTPYKANRTLAVLSSLFTWAGRNGYVDSGFNPCRDVEHFREAKKQTFLEPDDLRAIFRAIDEMSALGEERRSTRTRRAKGAELDTLTPTSAAAIKLLLLTGARKTEILSLQWENIDAGRGLAILPDSKTGFKTIPLPQEALELLRQLPRVGAYVFPSTKEDGNKPHKDDLWKPWKAVLRRAGLPLTWRVHDLRHGYASAAVSAGESLPIIGAVLGHKDTRTTQRYAHVAASPVQKAVADTVSVILHREKD